MTSPQWPTRSSCAAARAGKWRAEGVAVVSHRPRSRAVVLLDDADRLPDPVLSATGYRSRVELATAMLTGEYH